MSKPDAERRAFLKKAGTGIATTALVSFAGCAGSQGSSNQTRQNTDDQSANNQSANNQSANNQNANPGQNEFVYLGKSEMSTLDPAKISDNPTTVAGVNLYDPLLTIDPKKSTITSHLATEWRSENDGKTVVFDIREGVPMKSGGELTAKDVVYSMKRLLSIGLGFASQWKPVIKPENVSARDEYTVEFNLQKKFAPFISTLVQLFVVDSEVVKDNEQDGEHGERGDYGQEFLHENDAGTGSYTIRNWDQASELTLEAFDDYWGGWEKNQFDLARLQVIPEESTIKIQMQEGDGDYTHHGMSIESLNELDRLDNVSMVNEPQLYITDFPMNSHKKPTNDKMVRKAFVHAFDYGTLLSEIFPKGRPLAGPVPSFMPGHNDELEPPQRDLDKAKKAIDASQYTIDEINDMNLKMTVLSGFSSFRKSSLLLKQNLAELGVNIEIQNNEWTQVTEQASDPEAMPAIMILSHAAPYLSPDAFTYRMFHPSSFGTWNAAGNFTTEKITNVLEEARSTPADKKRIDLYKEAQKLIVNEYPRIFFVNRSYKTAIADSVGGWDYIGINGFNARAYNMYRK